MTESDRREAGFAARRDGSGAPEPIVLDAAAIGLSLERHLLQVAREDARSVTRRVLPPALLDFLDGWGG